MGPSIHGLAIADQAHNCLVLRKEPQEFLNMEKTFSFGKSGPKKHSLATCRQLAGGARSVTRQAAAAGSQVPCGGGVLPLRV